MSEPTSGAIPFPGDLGQTSETTSGGQQSVQWVEIVTAVSPMEANVMKSKLQSSDIPAIIKQESIGSVMGLTVGPLGSASVLVPEDFSEQALSILSLEVEPDIDEQGFED